MKLNNEGNLAVKEFMDKKFGMFIHWGVYSTLGGEWNGRTVKGELGECIMNYLQIPIAEYEKIAASFNPVNFDAEEIVKLAYDAGMKYIVITAKHCDGFAMFHSDCDRYNIYDWTSFKRDVIAELALACKEYDMKLGLYYAQSLDWHEEHAGGWEIINDGARVSWANVWDYPNNEIKDYSIYLKKKVLPQVKELLTKYGDIFLIWFDTPQTITNAQSEELYQLVKSLQPNCLVNSRIGNGKGDYTSLEDNQMPTVALETPNETPVTLNDTWGYRHDDHNWKTSTEIIQMLAKLISKNVNFLLNIGPMGDGSLTGETKEILNGISQWTSLNEAAIYNTTGLSSSYDFDWGYVTTAENRIYLCFKEDRKRTVEINGLVSKVLRASCLGANCEVNFIQESDPDSEINTLRLVIPETNLFMPVFAIECEDIPEFDTHLQQQGNTLALNPVLCRVFDGELKDGKSIVMGDNSVSYEHLGRIKIDCGGVLTGWSKCDDYLEWEAKFVKTGDYRVEIITSNRGLSDKGRTECEVEIGLSSGSLIKTSLKQDFIYSDSRTSNFNKRIGTVCGNLAIYQAGLYKIKMKLTKDLVNKEDHIPLVALKFVMDA